MKRILCIFSVFGITGCNSATNALWSDGPAPWESVDAFYYPDRNDLTKHLERRGLKTLEDCRDWTYATASQRNDPEMIRGDFECGIGDEGKLGDVTVYRLTVR